MTRSSSLSLSRLATLVLSAAAGGTLVAQDYVSVATIPASYGVAGGFFRLDLDGNGVDDLLIDEFNWGISVWLNPSLTSTSATLSFEVDILSIDPFGGWFEIKDLVDMNGDGFVDIAGKFSGLAPPSILYCPGDGLGGFGAPVFIYRPQGKVTYADFGDFNGDGAMDAVAANIPFLGQGPSDLVFYTGSPSGAFTLARTEPQTNIRQVFCGDFDGDGYDDTAWIQTGTLEFLPGGATGFGARQSLTLPPGLDDGFVSDLDGDGLDDLVLHDVIGGATSSWQVQVLWGDTATGLSQPQVVVPIGNQFGDAEYVGPFDIDGDGNDELLFVIRNTSGFVLVRHDGARNFSPTPYETSTFGGQIDLDGDGDLDQVATDFFGATFELRENIAIYGTACAGAAGEPTLDIGAAIPGSQTFSLTLANAAPNVPAQLFLSAAPIAGPCGPQIDFGQLLIPAANAPLFAGMTDASGNLMLPLPIPSFAPSGPYFFQAAVLDPVGAFNLIGYRLAATKGRAVRVY